MSHGALELTLSGLPSGQFGLLLCGPERHPSLPTLGNGRPCVAGPLVQPPVASTGTSGVIVTSIDWSAPGPAAIIAPGTTWSFQDWYRDPAGGAAGFDLSEALELQFQ